VIAADTSSLIAYLNRAGGDDIDRIEAAMSSDTLRLAPMVITELATGGATSVQEFLATAVLLPITDGYWLRAGINRRLLRSKGLKAATSDTLIAQCCIDADVPLIARDTDFRHFAEWCGLKLAD
jgi:predicted nucleic acid-binding protein